MHSKCVNQEAKLSLERLAEKEAVVPPQGNKSQSTHRPCAHLRRAHLRSARERNPQQPAALCTTPHQNRPPAVCVAHPANRDTTVSMDAQKENQSVSQKIAAINRHATLTAHRQEAGQEPDDHHQQRPVSQQSCSIGVVDTA